MKKGDLRAALAMLVFAMATITILTLSFFLPNPVLYDAALVCFGSALLIGLYLYRSGGLNRIIDVYFGISEP